MSRRNPAAAIKDYTIAVSYCLAQISHPQDVTLLQTLVVACIDENQRKNAVVDLRDNAMGAAW
jgi:hypothetical protein